MHRTLLVGLSIVFFIAGGKSGFAEFAPEISAICTPSPVPPGARGQIIINKLIDELLGSRAVGFADLRGSISYPDKRDALNDPASFCTNPRRSDVCGPKARTKLGQAYRDLREFVNAHRDPVDATDSGFEIGRNLPRNIPINVEDFLAGKVSAVCVVAPPAPGQGRPAEAKGPKITRRVMVRSKIEDLEVVQTADAFSNLDRASISIDSDFLAKSHTYSIDGVGGFAIGGIPVGDGKAELIAFGTYNRQFVGGSKTSGSPDIHNVSGGLLSNLKFQWAGHAHALQFFSRFLHADRTGLNTISGNIVYKLLTGPGIGQPLPLGEQLAIWFLPPQLKYSYSHVVDPGTGPGPVIGQDYQRLGGKLEVLIYGREGIFENLSFRAAYEYMLLSGGPVSRADRFETKLSYTFPTQEFWSFDLKFWSGRNLETFEQERAMTVGVGFKY